MRYHTEYAAARELERLLDERGVLGDASVRCSFQRKWFRRVEIVAVHRLRACKLVVPRGELERCMNDFSDRVLTTMAVMLAETV